MLSHNLTRIDMDKQKCVFCSNLNERKNYVYNDPELGRWKQEYTVALYRYLIYLIGKKYDEFYYRILLLHKHIRNCRNLVCDFRTDRGI